MNLTCDKPTNSSRDEYILSPPTLFSTSIYILITTDFGNRAVQLALNGESGPGRAPHSPG